MPRHHASGMPIARIVAMTLAVCMTMPAGASAGTDPAAARAVLAPTPTPAPAQNPVLRSSAATSAERVMDLKQISTEHAAALGRLQRRTYAKARRAGDVPNAQQTIQLAQHVNPAARSLDYCAAHPLEVERAGGSITPNGTVVITGQCFGTSGRLRMAGTFRTGSQALPDWAVDGIDFAVTSWTTTAVTARVPYVWGVPDKPVELRLIAQRAAAGTVGLSPNHVSAPIRLLLIAPRSTIQGISDVQSCATGASDALLPEGCGYRPWGAHACELGTCQISSHARRSPATGVDSYAIQVHNGFVLEQVQVFGDGAELVFDPSLDRSHVSWSVRWHTIPAHDAAAVKSGHPEFANYHDGSYLFYVTITGPIGVIP